jgi:hypothetical protein
MRAELDVDREAERTREEEPVLRPDDRPRDIHLVSVRPDRDPDEVRVVLRGSEALLRDLDPALGFSIDIELGPHMAFLSYDDVPGVIGTVGTMFGEAGVNIANMAVSRRTEGGKALMVFSVDSVAPSELVERVEAAGFDDVQFIDLG